MVMDLLGIEPNSIGEEDNLAGMGIDSMQVVEVRARIQRALGRPIPLEEVSPLDILCSAFVIVISNGQSSIYISCGCTVLRLMLSPHILMGRVSLGQMRAVACQLRAACMR